MILGKHPHIAALIIRITAGGLMLTHGYPKLMMLINGQVTGFPDPIGVGSTISLILAVGAEVFASFALIIGFKTKLAAIPLMITMIVAAFIVHGSDPLAKKELALMYLAMYAFCFFNGAGKFSLDRA